MSGLRLFLIIASLPLITYLWPVELGGDADFLSVSGNSMFPTMQDGSLAILKKDLTYDVGDIVAYQASESGISKVVIHRIVQKSGDGFVLKGDNNRSNDPELVKYDQIIGKAVFYVPYVGYLPILVKNPVVFVMTLLTTAVLFIPSKDSKKSKGKGISLFLAALAVNLANYVLAQIAISMGVMPRDPYTTFMLRFFEPYLASTMAFVTWHLVILTLQFIVRRSCKIREVRQGSLANITVQVKQESAFKSVAELSWMIFIGMYLLYMAGILLSLRAG